MRSNKKKLNHSKILLELDETKDIIVENQRGIKLFGVPFYSSNFLLPGMDPPNFQLLISNCDKDGGRVIDKSIIPIPYHGPGNPRNNLNSFNELYPLPWCPEKANNHNALVKNPCQPRRKLPRWYVKLHYNSVERDSLLNSCDDQGWIYSWRFRNKHWKGRYGLVRRRLWVKIDDDINDI